tara:strand:+ start:1602 stop:1796 length:195 start_codon:yes stop_codon:yes gene_type:complete
MRWLFMILAVIVLILVTIMNVKKNSKKKLEKKKREEDLWGEKKDQLIDEKSGLPKFIQRIIMPR